VRPLPLSGFLNLRLVVFLALAWVTGCATSRAQGLAGSDSWMEFLEHGDECWEKGDLDAAIRWYGLAIRVDPEASPPFRRRGQAQLFKGNLDDAIAMKNRACLRYDLGLYGQALEDAEKSLAVSVLREDRDYAALLAMLCRRRLGEHDPSTPALRRVFAGRDGDSWKDWPATIAAFLRGEISESDFLLAKESTDAQKTREQGCEAWFYAGTVRLVDGDVATAVDCFNKCVGTKMYMFAEYSHARAELARAQKEK